MKKMATLLGLLILVSSCNSKEKELQEEYLKLNEQYINYLDTVDLKAGHTDTTLAKMEARLYVLELQLDLK